MSETTTKKPSLFATAKTVEKKTTASKEKEAVTLEGYEEKLLLFKQLKSEEDSIKARKEMIGGEIKAAARELYLKLYAQRKAKPDSFNLVDGEGKLMLIVQDAYKKVEPAKQAMLAAYDDVLETTTVYTMDKELVEKYGEEISNAIYNCAEIPDDVKVDIIKADPTVRIKKGTIDRLLQFPNPNELFYLIEPTIALK